MHRRLSQKLVIFLTLLSCGKTELPKPSGKAAVHTDVKVSKNKVVIPRDSSACHLSAIPNIVESGASVNLTLTVNIDVEKATLDGETVSVTGGDLTRKPTASRYYFAKVVDKDNVEYECSVSVTVEELKFARAPNLTALTPTNNKRPIWFWTTGGGGNGNFLYCLVDADCKGSDPVTKETSYTALSDLTEGTHYFSVHEQNKADNNWGPRATFLVQVDLTAPRAPTLVAFANNLTKEAQPVFTWTPLDDVNGKNLYHLQVNNATFQASGVDTVELSLASPTQLSHGSHTVYVWQRDEAQNWSSAASMTFNVDIQIPGKPTVSCLVETKDKRPSWSWVPAGETNLVYRFRLDNADTSAEGETTNNSFQPTADLSEGPHTLYVQQKDLAGNWSDKATCTTAVDNTPPNNPNVTGPLLTNSVRPTWLWSSGGGGAKGQGKFVYRLDNSDLTGQPVGPSTSFTPSNDLSAGSHTIFVAEEDDLGNRSAKSSFTTIIDLIAPTVAFTNPLPAVNIANNAAYTLSGTCSEFDFDVTVSGAMAGAVKCSNLNTWNMMFNFSGMADGPVNFTVDHMDGAGNSAPQGTLNLVKDTQAPTVSFSASLPIINNLNKNGYTLAGACSENGRTVAISGAINASATCSSLAWSVSVDLSSLSDGSNLQFHADHTDLAANVASTANKTLTKDTVDPNVTLVSSGVINFTNKSSYALSGSCSESGRNVDISGPTTKTVSCSAGNWSTNVDLSSIPDSENILITATHSDAAGNVHSVSVTHRKDTVLPSVAFTTPLPIANITNNASYPLSGTCSENGLLVEIGGAVTTTATCNAGSWAINIDLSSKSDGISTITITANQRDLAMNAAPQASVQLSKDTVAPNVTLNTPLAINNSNKSAFPLSGTCSENGRSVVISGAASASGICNAGNWSANVNYSAISDGSVSLIINHSDLAGNSASPINTNLTKDTGLPTVTIDIPVTAITNANQTSFTLSGTCSENGRNVILGNAISATVACVANGWSTNINFSANMDGILVVTADHSDAAGNNATQASASILKDTNNPTVSIDPPVFINIANKAAFPISGNCSESGQNVTLGGVVSGVASCIGGGWTKQLNYAAVSDGIGSILLTANHQDVAGNSAPQASVNLSKDTVAPTFTLASLGFINGSNQSNYTLSGTCSDNGRSIVITGAVSNSATCNSGTWSKNIDFSSLGDGPVNLTFNFSDLAGNPATPASANLTKDTALPSVSLASLPVINLSNVNDYTISGTCSENGRPVLVGGTQSGSATCNSGSWSVVFDYSSFADGNISITADHSDLAGNNAAQDSEVVTKNTLTPSLTIATLGFINNANKSSFPINGNCSEAGQPVSLSVNSGAVTGSANCGGGTYSTNLNMSGLPDGTNNINVTANHISAVGNPAPTASRTTSKDTVNPTVAFGASPPIINNANKGNYNLTGTCSENGRSVVISGAASQSVNCSSGTFSANFDFSSLSDGTNINLSAVHTDAAGNTSSTANVVLSKDTGSPTLAIDILPALNIGNTANFVVSGDCSENSQPVEITGSKTASTNCIGLRWSVAINYTSVGDGANAVNIIANHSDVAGNPASQVTVNLNKDTVAPTVTITSGSAFVNASNSASFPVSGVCSENGRNLLLTSGSVNKTTLCSSSAWSTTMDLSSLSDSSNLSIIVFSDDVAGNSTTASLTRVKDTVIPTVTIGNVGIINASNQNSFNVFGTCSENGRTVSVGGARSGSVNCASGTWSINLNYSSIADGNVSITADLNDAAGNNAIQATKTVVKNTTSPTLSINSLGYINNANKNAFPVSGTCSENGQPVVLSAASGSVTGSVNCSSGVYSTTLNFSGVPDGIDSITLIADHMSAVGNPAPTESQVLSKDTVLPSIAFIGPFAPINNTNKASYTISGSCSENGRTVSIAGAASGSATCSSGAFSANLNFTAVADGSSINLSATHSDIAGNTANAPGITLIKDTGIPTLTMAALPTVNNSNKTNFIVSGTCSENGRDVTVSGSKNASATCSSGNWSVAIDYSSIGDGTNNVSILADHNDAAGNAAPQASRIVSKDTSLPTITLTSASGYVNDANKAAFAVSGTCSENGRDVVITSGSASKTIPCASSAFNTTIDLSSLSDSASLILTATTDDAAGNSNSTTHTVVKDTASPTLTFNSLGVINLANQNAFTVSGTCSENGRSVSVGGAVSGSATCSAGAWSVNLNYSGIADGSVSITANHSDVAGNSTPASVVVTKNTSTPTVTIGSLGAINNSNKTSFSVFGTCSENGRPVNVAVTPGGLTGAPNCSSGNWSTNFNFSSLSDQNYTITANHSNAAENPATPATQVVNKDTVNPTLTFDGGLPAINGTNQTSYVLSGTCSEVGQNIAITGAITTSVNCAAGGTFTKTVNFSGVADGTNISLSATHQDVAGNSISAGTILVKDTANPNVTINAPGIINNANKASFPVSGTCSENGRTVNLGGAVSGTATCSSGNWSTNLNYTAVADGTSISLTADLSDAAGNNATQAQRTLTKDTAAPSVSVSSPATHVNIANQNAFPLSGTCSENGLNVTLSRAGVNKTVACASNAYSTTVNFSSLADDTNFVISATHVDAAGNSTTSTLTVAKDTVAPTVTIGAVANINQSNQTSVTVFGTCSENGRQVAVGGAKSATPNCSSGNWSINIDYSDIADGNVFITADHSDAAGNPATQAQKTVVKNTSLPVVTINALGPINAANKANYVTSGTCSENGRVVSITSSPGTVTGNPNCVAGNWSINLNFTSTADGNVTITANHNNAAGNDAVPATRVVLKDVVIPTLAFNALGAINNSNKANFVVSGTCSENGQAVSITGAASGSVNCSSGAFSVSLDFSAAAEGALAITATHLDLAGNPVSVPAGLTKDTGIPTVAIDLPGYINDTNKTSFPVAGDCSENSRTVNLGGAASGTATCNSNRWSTSLNYSGVADGTGISLTADLTDAAGNPAVQATRSLNKDTSLPTITIVSPASHVNITNHTNFPVNGTCSENGLQVNLTSSSVTKNVTCNSGAWSTTLDLQSLGDTGSLTIVASHTDLAGNNKTSNLVVGKDTAIPTVTIGAVANINSNNEAAVSVFGTCSENGRTVTIGGAKSATATCSSGNWSVSINYAGVSDGSVLITADHNDAAGNPATQATRTVSKDSTLPTVAIGGIVAINNANKASYPIFGTCSESGRTVSLTSSPGTVTGSATCSSGNWSTNLNFTPTIDGNITITADHNDASGNNAVPATRVVLKDVVAPTVSLTAPGIINDTNKASFALSGACSENTRAVTISGDVSGSSTCSSNAWSVSLNFSALADGTVNISVNHSDLAGNPATTVNAGITKDTAIPTVAIDAPGYINNANKANFPVAGDCSENGRTVTLGGSRTGSATCSSLRWSAAIDYSSLADGSVITLTADHTDTAGNNAIQATRTLQKDTVAPALTVNAGASHINNTNKTSFSYSGTCSDNGRTVTISATGGPSTTSNCTGNNWSAALNLSSMSDGNITVVISQTDVAGNTGSTNNTTPKDTVNPTATVTQPPAVNNANKSNFAVSGTCSENTRTVTLTGSVSGSVTCSANAWSTTLNYSGVGDGTMTLTAATTDVAGNSSTPDSKTFPKDTVAPTVTMNALAAIVTGNVGAFPLSGTCNENGRNVVIDWSSSGGGSASNIQIVCVAGGWSSSLDMNSAGDGTVTFTANLSDAAGNNATPASLGTSKDTEMPSVSLTTPQAVNIANQNSYNLSGTCSENGRPVVVSGSVSTSANCTANNWSVNVNYSGVADGSSTVQITLDHSDSGGNNAPQITNYVNKDTVAPTVTISAGVGNILVNNVTSYTVSGTCSENTRIVSISIPGMSGQNTTCAGGSYSRTINASAANEGSITIVVSHTDAASNPGTNNKAIVKDTTGPTLTITSASSYITAATQAAFVVNGTCSEIGQSVVLSGTLSSSATCVAGNTWTKTLNFTAVSEGAVTVLADLTDAAGNNATQQTLALTKDTGVPTLTITGPSTINLSNYTSYVFSGTCSEPGRTVSLSGPITTTANCTGGSTWATSSQNLTSLAQGSHTFFADMTDAAGNPAVQQSLTRTKDTVAPTVTITSSSSYINLSNYTSFTISGTCSENTRSVLLSGTFSATRTCSGNAWSLTTSYAAYSDGAITVYANHSDAAGNAASEVTLNLTKDTVTPSVTLNTAGPINSVNDASLPISGTCNEPGGTINISGFASSTASCLGSNTWGRNMNYSSAPDGTITLNVSETDLAGNVSTNVMQNVYVDKTLPTNVQVSNVPTGNSGAVALNINVLPDPLISGYKEVFLYRYKISASSQNCSTGTYSVATSETINITDNISGLPDGGIRLCIYARDEAGNWQTASGATSFTWTKIAPPLAPSIALTSFNDQINVTWQRATSDVSSVGFLLIRSMNTILTFTPTNGTAYSLSQDLGEGATVIYTGANTSHVDDSAFNGSTYYYRLYAYSSAFVYSPLVSANAMPSPTAFETLYKKVAVGSYHSCAVQVDGSLWCWGDDSFGQLGDGSSGTGTKTYPVLVDLQAVSGNKQFIDIDTGSEHSCAINSEGKVHCWGNAYFGALGMNSIPLLSSTSITNPGPISDSGITSSKSFTQIATGNYHTCGLASDSKVFCWGRNENGELGDGTMAHKNSPTAINISQVSTNSFTQVSSGTKHSCALTPDGKIACWGDNSRGQLGRGVGPGTLANSNIPNFVDLTGVDTPTPVFSYISANDYNSCAVSVSGDVFCWGDYTYGQIGIGTAHPTSVVTKPTKVNVTGISGEKTFTQVSAGYNACAVATDGKISCWGQDGFGRLGNGKPDSDQYLPVALDVDSTMRFAQVSTGQQTCALALGGRLHCWGRDSHGQLGDGSALADQSSPSAVQPISRLDESLTRTFSYIGSGNTHSCAITGRNDSYCWGANANGQLGSGTTTQRATPWRANHNTLTESKNFITVEAGGSHTCGINGSGDLYCWGRDNMGQLGNGSGLTADQPSPYPVVNSGSKKYVKVISGDRHSCALAGDGSLWCWGSDLVGGLGDDATLQDKNVPVLVDTANLGTADGKFVDVTSFGNHTCGISSDGKAHCWGQNSQGQLGDLSNTNRPTSVPVKVAGGNPLSAVSKISCGTNHTCAVTSDGKAYCWGDNSQGQLGNGAAPTDSNYAQQVSFTGTPSEQAFLDITGGSNHTCARNGLGKVYCWGLNTSGQLGVNTTTANYLSPTALSSGSFPATAATVIGIKAGGFFTCAQTGIGKGWCWGNDGVGQLGDDATLSGKIFPVQVSY